MVLGRVFWAVYVQEDIADRVVESEAAEIREHRWERFLDAGLRCLGRLREDLGKGRKTEPWKVALARYLRERSLGSPELAEGLHTGG